ncbi:hypothetical protein Sta7437_2691 [Stanieria cyanosphaera PCC 7437]|uniref:Uncharacterized protein n=1 Tax=Stanieria cyanosphaera (strain ATCC 29371 / PCC 7437) TaxID=111780 RepID=K9XX15_STAC7|nr:hypothetical protein [Stanieria cyanosphaera]AFZ36217.1 hypothetical protein Sta7437_2691 [Stanieria cyanosphaera PCC 7437]
MAKNDYFLEPDDAQTFGNIEFMRKKIKVKRSFPKTIRNQNGFKIETEISSVNDRTPASDGYKSIPDYLKPETNSNNGINPSSAQSQTNVNNGAGFTSPEERRKIDTNMDMFRNMARSIKKR